MTELVSLQTDIHFQLNHNHTHIHMKKLILLILIFVAFQVKAQQNYWPSAIAPGSTSFSPSFRWITGVTDSLNDFTLAIGTKSYRFYSSARMTQLFAPGNLKRALQFDNWKQYIYEGDSITDTVGGFSFNWPRQLVNTSPDANRASQINVAQAGDQIQSIITEYTTQVHPYRPLYPNKSFYFFLMAGTNDAKVGRTSTQIYNDLKTEWAYAKADGFKIVAMCITRSTDPARDTTAVKTNTLIASDPTLYDYLVRTDLILPDPSNTTYFQGDGVHPNAVGSKMIAQEAINVLKGQFTGSDLRYPAVSVLNGKFNVGSTQSTSPAIAEITGLGVGAPAISGTTQSSGIIQRFLDQGSNQSTDFGHFAGVGGAWIQETDKTNLGLNYPIFLNPNGGTVYTGKDLSVGQDISVTRNLTATTASFTNNGKDALVVSDNTTQAAGVGGSVLFKGVYTTGGSPLPFGRISLEKHNSTNADYAFNMAFYVSENGGFNPGATPALKLFHDNSAIFSGTVSAGNFIGPGTGLTGTAASLSIGGNAATAANSTLWNGSAIGVGNPTTMNSILVFDNTNNQYRTAPAPTIQSFLGLGSNAYTSTAYQPLLVSGTNIKTVNGSTLLGSGDIAVSSSTSLLTSFYSDVTSTTSAADAYSYTVAANSLTTNGQYLDCVYTALQTGGAINTIIITFGGQTVYNNSANNLLTGTDPIGFKILRSGTTTARCQIYYLTTSGSVSYSTQDLTGVDFTTTNIIKASISSATAGTLTMKSGTITIYK
jgi:lysophospholipase L1-like esterase